MGRINNIEMGRYVAVFDQRFDQRQWSMINTMFQVLMKRLRNISSLKPEP